MFVQYPNKQPIAIYLRDLVGGGVERMMLNLANELLERGCHVDIVLEHPRGEFFERVPANARLISLNHVETRSEVVPHKHLRTRHAVKILLSRVLQRLLKTTGTLRQYNLFKRVRFDYWRYRYGLTVAFQYFRYLSRLPYLGSKPEILNNLCQYLKEEQPGTVITALEEQNFRLIIAKKLTHSNVRCILSVRNHLTTFFPLYYNQPGHKHYSWAIKRFYSKAYKVVAVSKEIKRDLVENFGVPAEKITIIYNPVVNPDIHLQGNDTTPDDDWLLGEFPVVLGVGRLHPQKGFDTLLRAFSLVVKEKKARLMILGSGPEEVSLKKLVMDLELSNSVRLTGFRENPFPYMKKSAVFVLSSVNEGLPGVLIQAMACGCPVVATDCMSGPREILEDGRWGTLVPVGNPQKMAEAILRSLSLERNTSEIIERAGYFNSKRATDQYAKLIHPKILTGSK